MTAQHSQPESESPVEVVEASETAYLQRQSDEARAAVLQALQQAKTLLAAKVDPRALVGRHPVISLGVAVAAGFAGAFVAIPSKEQQELSRLAKIRRAMHPEIKPATDGNKQSDASKPVQPFWMTLVKEAIAMLRPILTTVITANLAAHKPDAGAAAPQNGASDKP